MVPEATEAPILDEDIDLADASQDRPEGEAAAQAAAEEPQPDVSVAELDLAESAPEPQQPVEAEVTEMEPDAELAEEAVAGAEETEEDVAESASAEEEVAGVSASAGDATSPVVTDEPSQDAVADGDEAGVGQDEPVETAQVEEPAQPADTTDGTELTETELDIAALPLEESDEPATSSSAPVTDIFVEAVEIDGETVFVAGHAEPGRFVRVYANEILLGETRASEGGRFLIEARVDLPIGDYIIRADLLGSDGSVIARAAVPFEREPGESIAAVAPRAPATQPEPAGQGDASAGVEMEAGADERAAETAAAPAEERQETAAAAPEAGELSDEGQAAAAGATTEDQPAAAMAPSEGEPAVESGDQAAAADEAEETVPSPAASQQPELSAAETSDAHAEEQVAAPAGTPDTSGAPGEQMAAAEPGADATLSPALERVDGAVIIRRGDNLWRISRRVYGQGVRFSTIYLANQDQIRNPDLIWPGQVFTVPAETAQGEAADLEALGEQAVDPSQVPGEIIR
ncbi:LysM peptidoglycan-binding domain-containing protein [Chelativorans sp. ZYF759]|nr:LysM peptidoglycan-binding domain-containing protein [Chelativorans sp. ZYF759]